MGPGRRGSVPGHPAALERIELTMALFHGLHFRNLVAISSGTDRGFVALPLALAFSNAALGPGGAIYGLYGAVAAGFIAALLGGTPAQVSGP